MIIQGTVASCDSGRPALALEADKRMSHMQISAGADPSTAPEISAGPSMRPKSATPGDLIGEIN